MPSKALVLGITGGAGHAIAMALRHHGWNLRALHRDPAHARADLPEAADVEWLQGDAMIAADVHSAAQGCGLIVHGVNPAGYRNWRELALPMLGNSIEAAIATNARLLFPGNIYNYGPDTWPLISEQSPQNPISRKGQVRKEMEQMLATASDRRGLRVLIVRAGDFFGGSGPGAWMERVMIRPGKPVRSVTYPGDPDTGHLWAYLPDLGETFARLAEREADLARFETFHFGGHYLPRGRAMAEAIAEASGRSGVKIRRLPWVALRAMALFDQTARELLEMRYLWFEDIRTDNRKLLDFLGEEPHTPLDEALRRTLASLGCLPSGAPGALAATTAPAGQPTRE